MKLSNSIEAILFVSGKAVEISFIKEKLEATDKQMNEAIAELKAKYSGEEQFNQNNVRYRKIIVAKTDCILAYCSLLGIFLPVSQFDTAPP